MVKVKEDSDWLNQAEVHIEQWLAHLAKKGYVAQTALIRDASVLSQLIGEGHATEIGLSCFQMGLRMADILSDLQVDVQTLASAMIYETVVYADLSLEDVKEQFGPEVSKLIAGVLKMEHLSRETHRTGTPQVDNIRKMLLAMVDDVRVVLIKLAERICILRALHQLPSSMHQTIASEAMEIYAPLANRLGVGRLKWEIEDLAFRYLEPQIYRDIASGLNAKRVERDAYLETLIATIHQALNEHHIEHATVYGRSKHIFSIYRKMKQKQLPLAQIHDTTAVRVIVDTVEDCYQVLSIVHALWTPVPEEFDDYISQPKPNGYQSLHTALRHEGHLFEVQIRTYSMHEAAEMGVAAHWKYKEGEVKAHEPSHERKISWLREVLAWHKDMASQEPSSALEHAFLDDRIYVFTPQGDILDMPRLSTALDFAYHVHTQLGHRCRGVKVNGSMAPLSTVLKTGDRVEILTSKIPKPSRDWLNPHLNYLTTARAKAKVLNWFKMQDYEVHREQGLNLLEKEFKTLDIKLDTLKSLLQRLHYKTLDDLYAAVGRGEVKLSQILNRLMPHEAPAFPLVTKGDGALPEQKTEALMIEGVGQLLTSMAKCCQPLPGDEVIGYVTVGRGVSIHRKDCLNIANATEKQQARFLNVTWGSASKEKYLVSITIHAFDRPDLLKEITSLLATNHVHVYQLQTEKNEANQEVWYTMTIDIESLTDLSTLSTKLSRLAHVIGVKRQR